MLVYNGGQVVAANNECFGHVGCTHAHIKRAGMKDSRMDFPGRQCADVKVTSPTLDSPSSRITLGQTGNVPVKQEEVLCSIDTEIRHLSETFQLPTLLGYSS